MKQPIFLRKFLQAVALALAVVAGGFYVLNALWPDPVDTTPSSRLAPVLPHGVASQDALNEDSPAQSGVLAYSERKALRLTQAIVNRFTAVPPAQALRIVKAALHESAAQGLEPTLILAVCAVESSFNPHTISGQDHGLMQVNIRWQKEVTQEVGGPKALLDPAKNIKAGTKVLSAYKQATNGNVRRALRKYNGEGKANDYPDKVLDQKRYFDAMLRS